MKKLIIPLLLLVLACTGVYLFMTKPEVDHSYQSFIAHDAQIVITQYDLEKRVEEFTQSPLGRAFDTLEYELIGRELNIGHEDIADFLEIKQSAADLFNNQIFKTLFGAEVTCALFPFTYSDERKMEDQLLENLLVISRPKHGARLVDVARWFDFSTQTMSTSRYGSHTITRYDVEDGRRISGIRMNDLLVLSFNETLLRKSLDVYDGEGRGLFEVASYRDHIDQFSGASLIAYMDFQKLNSLIEEVSTQATGGDTEIRFNAHALAAYQMGLFGGWRKEDRIVDRAIITFSPDLLDDHTGKRFEIPVTEPRSHGQVDQETILYHWTNQFDFAYLVKMISDSEAPSLADNSPLNHLLHTTDLSYEQLAGLFTGDLTVAVKDLVENQLVPLPLFLISATSSDIELLKSSIDKLIEAYSIPVRRNNIGEHGELISWGGIIGMGSVLPAFAFNENSLIISSSRDVIKRYIDTVDHESLSDNERFKAVSDEIIQPSNSITYIEFDELTEMIKEMASWGGTMIAIKDRELAKKSKVLIDELINPILDGLAMYRVIGSRKYIRDNMIIFESQTMLDHGQQQP